MNKHSDARTPKTYKIFSGLAVAVAAAVEDDNIDGNIVESIADNAGHSADRGTVADNRAAGEAQW